MSTKSAKRPREKDGVLLAKVPRHLASSPEEFSVTQFEQGLLCAAEAFYRFYGALLGRDGRRHKLAGQDNVVLQQIMAASRPLSVADIARFANRDHRKYSVQPQKIAKGQANCQIKSFL